MKVKYIGKEQEDFLQKNNDMDLIPGKIYDVVKISKKLKWYIIIDESGEDYAYPPNMFEIVEN